MQMEYILWQSFAFDIFMEVTLQEKDLATFIKNTSNYNSMKIFDFYTSIIV